jgi:thiol-disulfide isomerase/thioredoxin
MRSLAVAALALTLVACGPKMPPVASPAPQSAPVASPAPTRTPTPNAAATPTPERPAPLLGHVTRAQLKTYAPWAPFWELAYVPDAASVASIKRDAKDLSVLLVMGTWCPDSKREMPRYFATMDAAGVGDAKLTMIGVDTTKKDTEGLTEKFNITRVPTFIFLRDGKEVARFVERTPVGTTFEAELARILRGGLNIALVR